MLVRMAQPTDGLGAGIGSPTISVYWMGRGVASGFRCTKPAVFTRSARAHQVSYGCY